MKRILTFLIMVLGTVLLAGCAKNVTTYTYHHGNDGSGVSISKAEYREDLLTLHVKGLYEIDQIVAYDADFNALSDDFTYQYKKNLLTIKGPDAEKISGLYIGGAWLRLHIRYLDSSDYALLYEVDATEIGWMLQGDKEKYYTAEELKEQQDKIDKENAIQEENFNLLEGRWVCTVDPNLYIDFYKNAEGEKHVEWTYKHSDGEYISNGIYIAEITISEGYKGRYRLEIVDDPYYGYQIRYEMSEDLTEIIDGQFEADDLIFMKEE